MTSLQAHIITKKHLEHYFEIVHRYYGELPTASVITAVMATANLIKEL